MKTGMKHIKETKEMSESIFMVEMDTIAIDKLRFFK